MSNVQEPNPKGWIVKKRVLKITLPLNFSGRVSSAQFIIGSACCFYQIGTPNSVLGPSAHFKQINFTLGRKVELWFQTEPRSNQSLQRNHDLWLVRNLPAAHPAGRPLGPEEGTWSGIGQWSSGPLAGGSCSVKCCTWWQLWNRRRI